MWTCDSLFYRQKTRRVRSFSITTITQVRLRCSRSMNEITTTTTVHDHSFPFNFWLKTDFFHKSYPQQTPVAPKPPSRTLHCSTVFFCFKPGFHYPSWWPELTAQVDGWPVSITRQHGPCWRVMEAGHPSTLTVNSGSGNRALVSFRYFASFRHHAVDSAGLLSVIVSIR